ncbi:MAG: CehA/McbA family metallohydrolase [Chloroflexi bacterium]|nr:CehA/McbA family metallohydrolase [Chloroflexota bacterium]MBU1747537.1 CehA/McbA family metallohydrolase [Chloroflexota bacterium]
MRALSAVVWTLGAIVLLVVIAVHGAGPAVAALREPAPTCLAGGAFHPTPAIDATSAVTPTIIFWNPEFGARAVPTATLVAATFSTGMDPATLTGATFRVSQGSTPISGSVRYIAISQVAVFEPAVPLAPDAAYTATVTSGARSTAGVPLAQNVAWPFSTTDGTSPLADGMHVYFGDLHSHSAYSDGKGTPADAFATARANGLDFFALTDHSSRLTPEEWQDMLVQANTVTVEGEFVGLRGFEFTHPKGHINVFDTDTNVWEGDPNYDTLPEFYAWLAAQPTAIGQFNHPAKTSTYDWNFDDWAYDAGAANKMCLRETPGTPPEQYLLSLDAGWHLGAVDNSDTHRADWGRWRFMGLVAPSLTPDAVLDALRARRTFFVYNRDSALVMQANGYWMGVMIPLTTTIQFTVTAYDPDPTDRILTLVLYDNGAPVASTSPLAAPVLYTWTTTITGTPGHYYYAKLYYDVDSWTYPSYTSPVWMAPNPLAWRAYLPLVARGYDGAE